MTTPVSEPLPKTMDPRVRRTRQLLHDALDRLLETRDFEAISIQEIADAATVNRATFYDHYPDKATLLRCLVALRFQALLDARGVRFDGSCGAAIRALALGVCDYLAGLTTGKGGNRRPLDPHVESAVSAVVKNLILDGLKDQAVNRSVPPGMAAATLGWAIYGGAREWLEAANRASSESAATTIMALVQPILSVLAEDPPAEARAEEFSGGAEARGRL